MISLQKLSRVHEAKDGTLKEECEEYAYFQEEEFMGRYDNPPDNTVIAGLNNSIWENSYVAEISKDAAETMSLEEITSRLFKDWIGTFQEWGDNSFIITEYKNFEIGGFTEPTEEENPASGITKADVTYPDAVKTWTVGLWCDFKIIGAYDGGFLKKSPDDFYVCGGGGAFGNDGVWQDSSVFQNSTKGFVLTEWEDCYTLETTSTCMDKVKEK